MNVPIRSKTVRLPGVRTDLLDLRLRNGLPLSLPLLPHDVLGLGTPMGELPDSATLPLLSGDTSDAFVGVIEKDDSEPLLSMLWRAAKPVVHDFLMDERGEVQPSNWRWSAIGDRVRGIKRELLLFRDIRRSVSDGNEAIVIVHRTKIRPNQFNATHLDWLIDAALQQKGEKRLEEAIHNLYKGNPRIFGQKHLKGLAQLMKLRSNVSLMIAYVLRDMAVRMDALAISIISEMNDFASDPTNMGATNVAYLMMSIAEQRPTWQTIMAHAIVKTIAQNDAVASVLKFSTHIFPESYKMLVKKLLHNSELSQVREVLAHIIQIHPNWIDVIHYSEIAGLATRHGGSISDAYAHLVAWRESPHP